MRLIDEIHLNYPYLGTRGIRNELWNKGHKVGRGHVRTLMRKMGVEALYRKPRLTKTHPEHTIYPYLLRGLTITEANAAWCSDITYIPMAKGFCYLVAIMDWASRKVLAWRLSNTLDTSFCMEALEEALSLYGAPQIFNTDQGSQFTSDDFTDILKKHDINTCPRCTIDNSSVIVAHGSGPDADIAPEMVRFGEIFGVRFVPHAVGDANRSARIERSFWYVESNFLAGRTFSDWHDLNEQAIRWCTTVANEKVKRSLGMSPEGAYVMEKPYLTSLPPYIPPVYQTFSRTVDTEGYVAVDTNRYSAPERLTGTDVEVHKLWDRVEIFAKNQKVADHPRIMDKRETKVTAAGHHEPLHRVRTYEGPCSEEKVLVGQNEWLDTFVEGLKKRSSGRGVRSLRRLLDLKRTYPLEAFEKATVEALHYGLFDLARLEQMILSHVAGDFFSEDEP